MLPHPCIPQRERETERAGETERGRETQRAERGRERLSEMARKHEESRVRGATRNKETINQKKNSTSINF